MTKLLFTPWEMHRLKPLYDLLQTLAPDEAYRLMSDLHAAERRARLGAMRADSAAFVRPRIAAAPRIAEDFGVDVVAEQFADYILELNLDSAFLMMLTPDEEKLAEVVDMGNVEVLEQAVASGRPVLLTPLHTGPVYASLGVLARRFPVTSLYHHIPLEELRDLLLPDLDLQGIKVPGEGTMGRCLEALAERRLLAIFPEFDPQGAGPLHVPLPFLGTTIAATTGLALIAQRAGALLVPYAFSATSPGRFAFQFEPAIEPGEGAAARVAVTEQLFRFCERTLLAGEPGKWEIWGEFERLADTAWLATQGQAAA